MNILTADRLKPRPGMLLLEKVETKSATQTSSGIYLPDSAKEQETMKVIAVGPEVKGEDPSFAKQNDIVIIQEYGGNRLKLGTKEYIFVRFNEILAVVDQS